MVNYVPKEEFVSNTNRNTSTICDTRHQGTYGLNLTSEGGRF